MPTDEEEPSPNEWHLTTCKAKKAWELNPSPYGKSKGEGIVIAHPDTGWTNHPELIKGGHYLTDPAISKNFFSIYRQSDESSEDILDGPFPGHGTSTASMMISEEGHPLKSPMGMDFPDYNVPAELFVTGIAPRAKLLPLRISNSVALGVCYPRVGNSLLFGPGHTKGGYVNTFKTLANAIYYAASVRNYSDVPYTTPEEEEYANWLASGEEVGVISISMGGRPFSQPLQEALRFARRQGIIVCAAAGQLVAFPGIELLSSSISVLFPGRSAHAICAAGCDIIYEKPPEGFYGKEVDITTPGWGVITAYTDSTDGYGIHKTEGTSHSTALTAGACALWQAYHGRQYLIETYGRPFLFDLFKYCLQQSCHKIAGWDTANRGPGVLDAEALLKYPLPDPAVIEREAILNNWTSADWGDSKDWGKL